MTQTRITSIDGQPMLPLTPEMLSQLGVSVGDQVQTLGSANGLGVVADEALAKQLDAARAVMREDAAALKRLAE